MSGINYTAGGQGVNIFDTSNGHCHQPGLLTVLLFCRYNLSVWFLCLGWFPDHQSDSLRQPAGGYPSQLIFCILVLVGHGGQARRAQQVMVVGTSGARGEGLILLFFIFFLFFF